MYFFKKCKCSYVFYIKNVTIVSFFSIIMTISLKNTWISKIDNKNPLARPRRGGERTEEMKLRETD